MYRDDVTPGLAGYAPSPALHAAIARGDVARGWRLGARVVSVQLRKTLGGGIWKNADRFIIDDWTEALATFARYGIKHPSSWADCYHQKAAPLAPLKYTFNGMFSWFPGGPWAEARRTGTHKGTWHRYDLQGAYRSAATWGLPDPATFSCVSRWDGKAPGLFVAELREDRGDLPPVFRERGARTVVSHEEIERYNLSVRVVHGVTWTREFSRDYVERTLERCPYPRNVARAYWGRWIARDPLTCFTPNAEWSMRNLHANFVFGWLIVGRVRLRVWEVSTEAAHVYVDEVLVPHELPTGGEGEWKLKETYPDGVTVHRTGWYGDARAGSKPTMQTGVPHNE